MRAKEKEKRNTDNGHIILITSFIRSFYSIFFIDQPTHNSRWFEPNNIDCGTSTGKDE
jgi:hypothetical protein